VTPTKRPAKIIHIDMDAFFVSVELRDRPELQGLPVAVGGSAERRGVISTCNYVAREYGVHSALSTSVAMRRCPNLVLLKGRMSVYHEVSQQIRRIFHEYSAHVEPLSLDEAYLDVTNANIHRGSASLIAQEIRERIYHKTGLTASAGVSSLKFIAKIASDINKPNGQFVVTPEQIPAFIDDLELKRISGVGRVTQKKLESKGFLRGRDVKAVTRDQFVSDFGKFGGVLWDRCQGEDGRIVAPRSSRKSVAVERTFSSDIESYDDLKVRLYSELLPELERRASKYIESSQVAKLGVKLKFSDFQQITSETLSSEINYSKLDALLVQCWGKRGDRNVRLAGIFLAIEEKNTSNQMELF